MLAATATRVAGRAGSSGAAPCSRRADAGSRWTGSPGSSRRAYSPHAGASGGPAAVPARP